MEAWESLPGGLELKNGGRAFALGTDTMVLADFVPVKTGDRFCDLGCGGGALGLLLLARGVDCRVTGVELSPDACALAGENIRHNRLEERFSLVPGDLRQIRKLLPAGGFTGAVANPPYFSPAGPASPDPDRDAARSQRFCSPEDLCAAAAWVLQSGGSFSLVYRPDGLTDLFCALRSAGLEPKRLRPVCHRPGAAPGMVLIEARRRGRPGLRWEPTLYLYDSAEQPTTEYRRIYHMEGGR